MAKNYNVTGTERKALVNKISELSGENPVYLGMPTVAFKIGPFEVSRTGVLTWEEQAEESAQELVRNLQAAGFTVEEDTEPVNTEQETTDAAETAQDAAGTAESTSADICEETAQNAPEAASTALAAIHQNGIATATEAAQEGDTGLTIELPDTLSDEQFALLERLVAGKETLIKHAFQTDDLTITRKDGQIAFPWFTASDGDHTMAYSQFLTSLLKFVKKAKRVTVHDKQEDNEKFSFRIFMIRLGMVGDEFKASRKILMENLSGNSAWKNGAPENNAAAENQTEVSE